MGLPLSPVDPGGQVIHYLLEKMKRLASFVLFLLHLRSHPLHKSFSLLYMIFRLSVLSASFCSELLPL
ncbi:hypothetical protein D3C87_2084460 [compost metagenome]